MAAIHRDTDLRACGATTNVVGQSSVYVNGLLASVKNDPNSHRDGNLNANINDGTVFIENQLVVLLGSSASKDKKYITEGVPHNNPSATTASPDVFACGGS